MKKNIKLIIMIILIVVVILIGIKFIPFGYHEYQDEKMMSNLIIPKLSVFDEECCMFSSNFKSFRSVYSLKKELNNIMNNYEKISCDSRTYYYDRKNDITITGYGVKSGFIINSFFITYDKGNYCE